MAVTIRTYAPADLEALRALVRHPSLAVEFDAVQVPQAVEAWIADPFRDPELLLLAWVDGELAAFAGTFVLDGHEGRFVMTRAGVHERHRRRGIGRELIERTLAGVDRRHPDVVEISTSFWLPNPAAEAFAAAAGLTRVRTFWLMERPRGPATEPAWPAGIRIAGYEANERVWRDLADSYNDSFAHHYHSPRTTMEDMRDLFERPGMRTDGHVLAYRGETCVGFCRGDLHESRGEIAVLGTVEAARGIGLGRALLRWGVAWLERENAPRITLLVDGDNENALRLYRSEGFEVVQTRAVWSRERVPTTGAHARPAAAADATSRET